MKIVVACGSLPFGPNTTNVKSLGGSETAALMASRELAKRGHEVLIFSNLPAQGQPDHVALGSLDEFGVRWMDIRMIQQFAMINEHDLYIAVRDPALLSYPILARKRVLWAHDIFTKRGMQRALDQMAWTFDEIWAVSEWHRHQINEATGYPLEHIVALRNGIVPVTPLLPPELTERKPKQLLYAARPERGLENLVKVGGIMERLPEYKLVVCMYDHYPPDMKEFYQYIFTRMDALPNVEFLGPKAQPELRQLIAESEAYIYPTQFEETSCILAREVIEQRTPIFTTFVGALPETLGECGTFFEPWLFSQGLTEPERGSPGWCQLFAEFVKQALASPEVAVAPAIEAMAQRTDLYWDGVAALMEENAKPREVTTTSRIWSLIQAGDVIPAMALMNDFLDRDPGKKLTPMQAGLLAELSFEYSFIDEDMQTYYDRMYTAKADTPQSELKWQSGPRIDDRWKVIEKEIAALPPGSRVFELGCGAGHVLAPLAKLYPNIYFTGSDFSTASINFIQENAAREGLTNLDVFVSGPEGISTLSKPYDALICTEVLEHVKKPWELLTMAESLVKEGGRVILTTPFGAWEPLTYEQEGKWSERAHLWHIDQKMMKEMVGDKPGLDFIGLVQSVDLSGFPIGNLVTTYNADHGTIRAVDPLAKAYRHLPRQTTAAAVIAYNNEDTVIRMLNSLQHQVQFVRIALGPATDHTREYIEKWFSERPFIRYEIVDVPKIEPYKFGFDEARNISADGLAEDFDWFLWIDTDEYLSGNILKYLRFSSMQGYLLAQHHFTVEPRGRAAEIDRPARLLRTSEGYRAHGHIHEHFEIAEGGPGRAFMLPDIDIGHTGYVNENVRKARFTRNFDFLVWDHEEEGEKRKLHHFLWFRDIVHRMRFKVVQGDKLEAVKLAREAVEYYDAHTDDMGAFGPGIFIALQYLGECNSLLGKGVPMKVTIQFDDRQAALEGVWTDYNHFDRVMKQFVATEFTERESRYY